MRITITILCDNSISSSGLIGEHGFSLLIERGEQKYLFDTGPGMSLPRNLKALNKDLHGVEKIFISHGHYDHTGGLKWVIRQLGKAQVVAHPGIFSSHMLRDPQDASADPRYIGCPFSQVKLEHLGAVFNFINHPRRAVPGLWFITGIQRKPEFLPNDARLLLPRGERFVADTVDEDASILLETSGSPILIFGCAHSGVLNILKHVRRKMGITRLRGVLGGTHLMFYGPENTKRFIDELEKFSVDFIGVSHCTGLQAAIELSNHFGDRVMAASAGTVLDF
jgi:7,8-dihydropterin-6-yl-methyl-4-(beta-D-ribofuranosyl)aminobenzene 5'-phosphate synthase